MESPDILYFASSPCQIAGVQTSSGTYRPMTELDLNANYPLDFSGTLPNVTSGTFTINNPGYSTIGFHLDSTSGVNVGFYGSFNGEDFTPITFRQIGDDGYTKVATYVASMNGHQDYIGSISSLRSIKFIAFTSGVSGSVASVAGRMSPQVSTLEGIENSAAPHSFGNTPFHRGFYLNNTTGSGVLVYQPPSGFRFVVTSYNFSALSTAGANISLYEDGDANNPNYWLFSSLVKTPATQSMFSNFNLTIPYVSSMVNAPLNLFCDGQATVRGVVNGYYTV